MTVAAVIVAAGRGHRAGRLAPKQYVPICGRSVLARTLDVFLANSEIASVQPVIHAADAEAYAAVVRELAPSGVARLRPAVHGGETRQASVLHGLDALAAAGQPEMVLVHDAARPFVTNALIATAIASARRHGAATAAIPVTDTIQTVDEAGTVADTLPRDRLRAIQTPQSFSFERLVAAHRAAAAAGMDGFGDDGGLAAWAGMAVTVFPGDPANVKLTHPSDFEAAERRMQGSQPLITRLGTGFDVHAFGPGDHIWLGGLRVAHGRGVEAHSDGDVVLHALTDAVLGALADGDIGTHFPPSDPQWRGASSDRFLAFAVDRLRAAGGILDHLDATVLCEAPRIGPHREAMRARIAEIAGIGIGQVSIKATTTEQLGFVGRREGIAAQAAATVRVPVSPA
jgi:2-C-methyl-D-erythritol 4-phosphate cytidylyltransferase/2-C-methyl-D-erythritol 2,4-cyclodiphosphate synthase